jgi:hypothetical protein
MKPLRSTAPRSSLLHPERPYTNSASTDVAATFARIRAQMAQAKAKVQPIKEKKHA